MSNSNGKLMRSSCNSTYPAVMNSEMRERELKRMEGLVVYDC